MLNTEEKSQTCSLLVQRDDQNLRGKGDIKNVQTRMYKQTEHTGFL